MRVAFTADLHLSSNHKERLKNFEEILKLLELNKINRLVIAGDLFDKDFDGYKEVDQILKKYSSITTDVLPGNHDNSIDSKQFHSDNINVYSEPEIISEYGRYQFLLLPYRENETIGRFIEKNNLTDDLKINNWILVSHGDYGNNSIDNNGDEYGYFPLTKQDIKRYKPIKVILGHIHKPGVHDDIVYYPGSPYPLNINETGQRRILIWDSESSEITNHYLDCSAINFNEEIFVVPNGNEYEQIIEFLKNFFNIEKEKFSGDNFFDKITMRLSLSGYSSTRKDLVKHIEDYLNGLGVAVENIDAGDLNYSDDPSLTDVIEKVKIKIEEYNKSFDIDNELKNKITKKAYEIIFS